MPTRRIATTLVASATSPNILESDWLRTPGRPGMMTIACTVPSAAANTVLMNVELSSDLVAKDVVVPVENLAGSGPQVPYNLMVEEGVAPGDQIIITFTETAAATPVVSTLFIFE